MAYINKYVTIEQETWDKVKEEANLPQNKRAVGAQAGVIIKDHFDNNKEMKAIWKKLINELDEIIAEVRLTEKDRLDSLMKKRALLETAFNSVGV